MLNKYFSAIDKGRVLTYKWVMALSVATFAFAFGLGMLAALHYAASVAHFGICK